MSSGVRMPGFKPLIANLVSFPLCGAWEWQALSCGAEETLVVLQAVLACVRGPAMASMNTRCPSAPERSTCHADSLPGPRWV